MSFFNGKCGIDLNANKNRFGRPYFKNLILLYGGLEQGTARGHATYPTLHSYLQNEHADDVRVHQACLAALPRAHMQRYFQEKNAAHFYPAINNLRDLNEPEPLQGKLFEMIHTDDVYGKHLKEYR